MINERKPLVTVIVPTKNRSHFLAEALESILNQTYKNFEVIVVNDGGKDVSELLSKFKDKRIRYIQHETSKGPAAARNCGLKVATGEYIAYLDDDDIYYPNHLEILITFLEKNNAHFAYTDSYEAIQEKKGYEYITTSRKLAYGYDFDRQKFLIKDYIPILTVMHRKDCVEDVGMFDESLGVHEDWDLWIRLSGKFDFHHMSEVTSEFRTREDGDSITSDNFPKFIKVMKEIHAKYSHVVTDPKIVKTQKAIVSLNEARIDQKKMVTLSAIKLSDASKDVMKAKISIIMPVKNGCESFSKFIKSVKAQKRVGAVEIIVLDEGMTDDTLCLVKESGAKIIRLDPDEFKGGRDFNLAVSESEGNFIVFVGRDALPVSNYWLYNMIRPFIEYPALSALTGRKFIQPEADLFSLWVNDSEAKSGYFKSDSMSSISFNEKKVNWNLFDRELKNRLTCFNSQSSCVRREIMDEIQFSPADDIDSMDIDYGIELLENEKTLGYMVSTGVYHWHTRSAGYLLKESYDISVKLNIHFNDLPYFFDINNISWEDLISNITDLYNFINVIISKTEEIDLNPVKAVRYFINEINSNNEISREIIEEAVDKQKQKDSAEDELSLLIKKITGYCSCSPDQSLKINQNFLFPEFISMFGQFTEYLCSKHQTLSGRQDDFISCIYKIFAVTAGEVLGAFYLESETLNNLSGHIKNMDEMLRREPPLSIGSNKR